MLVKMLVSRVDFGLELKHRLQKKKLVERNIEKKVDPKNNILQKWMEKFNREEIRAVQGLGKYHLAQEHQTLAADPATWDKRGKQRQIEKINLFHQYSPSAFDAYKKPKNAFLETTPWVNKRRARLPELQLFEKRVEVSLKLKIDVPSKVSPVLLNKRLSKSWQVNYSWNTNLFEM